MKPRITIDTNKISVVTESKTDTAIILATLPNFLKRNIQVIECDGSNDAYSMARSILALKKNPTLLIIRHNTNEESIQEHKDSLESSLLQASRCDIPCKVFLLPVECLLLPVIFKEKYYTPLEKKFAYCDPKSFLLADRNGKYHEIIQNIIDRLEEKAITDIRAIRESDEFWVIINMINYLIDWVLKKRCSYFEKIE